MNYDNNDEWIKQLVLTVGKPMSTCQPSDRRYIYSLWVRYIQTIYVYVIFMVYSDGCTDKIPPPGLNAPRTKYPPFMQPRTKCPPDKMPPDQDIY